ncbi:hypothetical protein AAH991_25105 [Microbispora sp. ZYX-F-249]|uniref:DivIVA domain-containing protein n=1 Tax=Microbispora maris TaxID=3144104 RepID=A0ABV0AT07_9ACTN
MLVVLVIAGLAVIVCVVMVSLGRGGEMAEFPPDAPPLDLPAAGQVTPADLIALQLPIGLVGYSTQAVDETLHRVSVALGERDTRIAVLEQRVAELSYARPQVRQETPQAEAERTDAADESLAERDRAEAEEAW